MNGISHFHVPPALAASVNRPLFVMEREFFDTNSQEDKPSFVTIGQQKYSYEKPIIAYGMEDGIALFAIEKEEGQNAALFCWHIEGPTSYDQLREQLDAQAEGQRILDFFERDKTYDFYLIGGNEHTTRGYGCLLENIKALLQEKLSKDSQIKQEILYPQKEGKTFASAKMHLDGRLFVCFHDSTHDFPDSQSYESLVGR